MSGGPDVDSTRASATLPLWPLALCGAITAILRYPLEHRSSFHFFADAARDLFHPGGSGLSLYAVHPKFQFGPLAVAVAALFEPLPHALIHPAVVAFGTALGVATIVLAERTVLTLHPDVAPAQIRRALWWGAVPFLMAWTDVAVRNEHIDDSMALTGIVASVLYVARRRPWLATLAMSVAVAAKPWAVVCVPLLLAADDRYRWWRPPVACAAAGATWVPFLVGDSKTLSSLSSFHIGIGDNSLLRWVGDTARSAPGWDRPGQAVLGIAAALLLVRWHRWAAVPVSALGVRLLLDPATHRYYAVGLGIAVLLWEQAVHPTRPAWRSVVAIAVIELTSQYEPFHGRGGEIRNVVLLAAILLPVYLPFGRLGSTLDPPPPPDPPTGDPPQPSDLTTTS